MSDEVKVKESGRCCKCGLDISVLLHDKPVPHIQDDETGGLFPLCPDCGPQKPVGAQAPQFPLMMLPGTFSTRQVGLLYQGLVLYGYILASERARGELSWSDYERLSKEVEKLSARLVGRVFKKRNNLLEQYAEVPELHDMLRLREGDPARQIGDHTAVYHVDGDVVEV